MNTHTQYTEMFADVTGYIGQRARGEKYLGILERMVKVFKTTLVVKFDKYCDCSGQSKVQSTCSHVGRYKKT